MGREIGLSAHKATSTTSAMDGLSSLILIAQASGSGYQSGDAIGTEFGKMIFQGVKGDGYRYVAGHTKTYRVPPHLYSRDEIRAWVILHLREGNIDRSDLYRDAGRNLLEQVARIDVLGTGLNVGDVARNVGNVLQNVPIPGIGLTPKQTGQLLQTGQQQIDRVFRPYGDVKDWQGTLGGAKLSATPIGIQGKQITWQIKVERGGQVMGTVEAKLSGQIGEAQFKNGSYLKKQVIGLLTPAEGKTTSTQSTARQAKPNQTRAPDYQIGEAIGTDFGKMIFQGEQGDGYRYVAGHTQSYPIPAELQTRDQIRGWVILQIKKGNIDKNDLYKDAVFNPLEQIAKIDVLGTGQNVGEIARNVGNVLQNVPIPGIGLTPKQAGQLLQTGQQQLDRVLHPYGDVKDWQGTLAGAQLSATPIGIQGKQITWRIKVERGGQVIGTVDTKLSGQLWEAQFENGTPLKQQISDLLSRPQVRTVDQPVATVKAKDSQGLTLVTQLKAQESWVNGRWQTTGYRASGVSKYSPYPITPAQARSKPEPDGYFVSSVPGKERLITDVNDRPLSNLQQAQARVQEMIANGGLTTTQESTPADRPGAATPSAPLSAMPSPPVAGGRPPERMPDLGFSWLDHNTGRTVQVALPLWKDDNWNLGGYFTVDRNGRRIDIDAWSPAAAHGTRGREVAQGLWRAGAIDPRQVKVSGNATHQLQFGGDGGQYWIPTSRQTREDGAALFRAKQAAVIPTDSSRTLRPDDNAQFAQGYRDAEFANNVLTGLAVFQTVIGFAGSVNGAMSQRGTTTLVNPTTGQTLKARTDPRTGRLVGTIYDKNGRPLASGTSLSSDFDRTVDVATVPTSKPTQPVQEPRAGVPWPSPAVQPKPPAQPQGATSPQPTISKVPNSPNPAPSAAPTPTPVVKAPTPTPVVESPPVSGIAVEPPPQMTPKLQQRPQAAPRSVEVTTKERTPQPTVEIKSPGRAPIIPDGRTRRAPPNGTLRNGTQTNGNQTNGTPGNGTQTNGTQRNGMPRNVTQPNGIQQPIPPILPQELQLQTQQPLALPASSRLPEGVNAVIRNPDGSFRAWIKTQDDSRIGIPVETRPNGKAWVRTGTSVPDGERTGLPRETYNGLHGNKQYGQSFGPVVELPKAMVSPPAKSSVLSKAATSLRAQGIDIRLGFGFKVGLQIPGVEVPQNPWIDLHNIQIGNLGSGSVVIGADSFTDPQRPISDSVGFGLRGAEVITVGPNVARYALPTPVVNAAGLQMKVSSLSREVIKAFQGQPSPFVFERQIGAESAQHDWLKIPGKLTLNVLPINPNTALQDVFGVAIRPNTKYYTLQQDLTFDKAMLEQYAKSLLPIPVSGLPISLTGERRHETAGKITIEKGSVLPQEFVSVINRTLNDIKVTVNVPVRYAENLRFSGDQLRHAFEIGPQGQPPRIPVDPNSIMVTFDSTGAIRISSVPGRPLYNRRGQLSQDSQAVDFMFVGDSRIPSVIPQAVPGVPNLFNHVSPYGDDGKVRYKVAPSIQALTLGVFKLEVSGSFVRDAKKVSPAVQDPGQATFTFQKEQRVPSGQPGVMTTRWVDASIQTPAWMSQLFARDINTLPAGARQSILKFLDESKRNASPEQLQAIADFEATALAGFKDKSPLKIALRDELGALLKALALPNNGPGSAYDLEMQKLLERQPAPKGRFYVTPPNSSK